MNRRATTNGQPIKDNRIYEITIMRDGYRVGRSAALYYRRRLQDGTVYTGLADQAWKALGSGKVAR
jgi:hypothetical protein